MKNKKFIIIAVILTIGLVYWFILRPKIKARKSNEIEGYETTSSNSSFSSGSSSGNSPVLSKTETEKIQMAANRVLSKQGKTLLIVDGSYGPLTKQAVKSIVGKELATYSEVKAAVISWFESNGYGNPYSSSSSSTGSENNTSSEEASLLDQWLQWGGLDGNIATPW